MLFSQLPRGKTRKDGTRPALFLISYLCCLVVLFYVLFVRKCVLPPGDNPIAVNKYIISYNKEVYFMFIILVKYMK